MMLSAFTQTEGRAEPLKVVATLSAYADIAKTIGGAEVEVSFIAAPIFDPHFIEPRPTDILRLKRADLFIHGGLDLEAWRGPLVNAVARADIRPGGAAELDLSKRIKVLDVPTGMLTRADGDIHIFGNPHYWLDPRNGLIIAEDVANKLQELKPDKKSQFASNYEAFKKEITQKFVEWRSLMKPYQGAKLVAYHNGWSYFMNFIGLKTEVFLEPKPGIPPTPRHLEDVTKYIEGNHVKAIIQFSFNPTDAARSISKKTGVKSLVLSQGVGDVDEVGSYIEIFDYNVRQLEAAMRND
jgi:zinc/manganese transport system substrate-binding protein